MGRVGPRILLDRSAKKMTQLDLANRLSELNGKLQYSSQISVWENDRYLPTEEHRLLLARALGKPADRYFALSQPDDAEAQAAAERERAKRNHRRNERA